MCVFYVPVFQVKPARLHSNSNTAATAQFSSSSTVAVVTGTLQQQSANSNCDSHKGSLVTIRK